MMNKKGTTDEIIFPFLIIGIILLLLNLIFWFSYVPKDINSENICSIFVMEGHTVQDCMVVFDGHGFSGWSYLVLGLLVLEIAFILLVLFKKKRVGEKWKIFALKKKFLALGITLLFYSAIVLLWAIGKVIEKLIEHWDKVKETAIIIIVSLGLLVLVGIWYLINVEIAKRIAKEKQRKFKVGDKVKIRKDLKKWEDYDDIEVNSNMYRLRGKKVTVEEYTNKDRIRTKEDKGYSLWSEEMFEDNKK